jgi:membrane-bound metal-dependent hydrolase YbcI (DUF457 family)
MWFLGHVGLGFFAALAASRLGGGRFSLPLVFLASVVPDVDVLLEPFVVHRGPLHGVVLGVVVFAVWWLWARRGLPVFASFLTHSLVGDYVTGPTMLFWPFPGWYEAAPPLRLSGVAEFLVEASLFVVMVVVVVLSGRGTGSFGLAGGAEGASGERLTSRATRLLSKLASLSVARLR